MLRIVLVSLGVLCLAQGLAPISTGAPPFPTQANTRTQPTDFWGSDFSAPYPTNEFYMNFVAESGHNPVNLYPFIVAVRRDNSGLGARYPTWLVSNNFTVSTEYSADVTLGAAEGPFQTHQVTRADPISVTLNLTHTHGRVSYPLMRGSPYLTARYFNITPELQFEKPITSIALPIGTEHATANSTLRSNRFIIKLASNEHWILYCSKPVKLKFDNATLTFNLRLTGTLRLAHLGQDASKATLYDQYRDTIATSSTVDYTFNGNQATISYEFQTTSLSGNNECGSQPKDLILFSLPHHRQALQSPKFENLTALTLRGQAKAVKGKKWIMKQPLSTYSWDAPRNYTNADWKEAVRSALRQESDHKTNETEADRISRQLNKIARMALIADSLNETSIASVIRSNLISSLEPYINGTYFNYDSTWGGIIDKQELPIHHLYSNAQYFDHTVDYGYFIYAIATIVRKDVGYFNTYKEQILALVRDIINPSTQDTHFPLARGKDWYLGVTWEAGVYEFFDNRELMSSSATVNSYYALMLLGEAIGNQEIYDFARLLMATEMRSAKQYFHIRDDEIYPEVFAKNGMVGVFWDTKVDFQTYIGNGREYNQAVQMRPFSPISEELLDYEFTLVDYGIFSKAHTKDEWLSYKIMDEAILDPVSSWSAMNRTTIEDWGDNSLTNTLWWIATRPSPQKAAATAAF